LRKIEVYIAALTMKKWNVNMDSPRYTPS